ncbi:MAG: Transcriptional regulator, XRE family [uncultured bacterium]|nr:MAG: Transcriptional regulator, XRE family [uncultured bacterium]HBG19968.1 transcriptional regulator [Desulfobulbaceae bacterium]
MKTLLVSPGGMGVVLRDLRRQQGLTQAELGKRVGLDQKKVSLIESGNANCRIDSLFRLLSALGVGLVVQPKTELKSVGKDDW